MPKKKATNKNSNKLSTLTDAQRVNNMNKGRERVNNALKMFLDAKHSIQIEKTPPTMPSTRNNPQSIAYRERLLNSISNTPVDGAFIIPTVLKAVTQRMLKNEKELSGFKFKFFSIPDNTEMTRVYKKKI